MIPNQTGPKIEILRREIRDRAGRVQAVVLGFGSVAPAASALRRQGRGGGSPSAGDRDPMIDSVGATPAQRLSIDARAACTGKTEKTTHAQKESHAHKTTKNAPR